MAQGKGPRERHRTGAPRADSSRPSRQCRSTAVAVWVPFFQILGLVDQQQPVRVPKFGRAEVTNVGTDRGVVPACPTDQVLHTACRGVTGVFCDRSALLGRQRRKQPGHEVPDPAPGVQAGSNVPRSCPSTR